MPRPAEHAVDRRACLGLLAGIAALGLARGAAAQAFAEGPDAIAWFERASELAGFTTGEGDAAPAAVVFFDARCPHCTRLWADMRRPLAPAPPSRWRGPYWRGRGAPAVPLWGRVVGLAPASARQAAALLRARDPVAAMDAHVRARSEGGEGIAADTEPDTVQARALRENTAMLRAMQVGSVPAILHRDRSGRVGLTVGAMPAAELGRLAGSG